MGLNEQPSKIVTFGNVVDSKPVSRYRIIQQSYWSKDISEVYFTVHKNGIDKCDGTFTFYLLSMDDASGFTAEEKIIDSSSWISSMSCAATNWLSQCLESHLRCQAISLSGSSSYIPTRLLQIGQPSAEKISLLLHPSLAESKIQYATVSHCWGGSSPLKLTSASLPLLEGGFPVSQLAQVFQDAIFTARSLGIQFLWIDSLCIFQDSQTDWQQESPLMSNVYRCAVMNIAASVAANSNMACFPDRDLSIVKPCIIQTSWTNTTNDNYLLYHNKILDHTFDEMPLNKRAWVVQELLLAPRVLYLTGTQLFWECYDLTASETYPGGIPSGGYHWKTREALWAVLNYSINHSSTTDMLMKSKLLYISRRLWAGIVEIYTACNLTYTTDKLVALSGIARIMEPALDDKYCAGLWEKHLAVELSWSRSHNIQDLPQGPRTYCAPSWSWASLDGRIAVGVYSEEDYNHLEMLINLMECKVETATDDTFGMITGGSLMLSGLLATVRLCPDPVAGWHIFFNGSWWPEKHDVKISLDRVYTTLEFHCLPLFLDTRQLPTWHVTCLLLEPTGIKKGQFKRVGILLASTGALGMISWNDFQDIRHEHWLEYESILDKNRYRISIL
ncbi:hypothetical protein OIDMADRAFT_184232 [Oidiodendron maius Zn]|uniref:Heterokaryon incompatibility domain-containing protein n=1 Tax=Oidiodendron maius (strain Zn) TaxID=913774 RepID=A0A0C3C8C9_OIDMZ|nr:hypothetical protein OIDMADRAFT_184232 [Oidiodendron maius Zn]